MLTWLLSNLGTIIITALLIALVSLIIVKLRKDKKSGVSSCGGNCSQCAAGGCCHKAG